MCPRYKCAGQSVMPVGMASDFDRERVKIYCPRCHEIFIPSPVEDLDSAAFAQLAGVSLPNILLKTYPELNPREGKVTYVPKLFGFKIFGQVGSKYEYEYSLDGAWLNEPYIKKVLWKPPPKKPKPPQVDIEKVKRDKHKEYNL